MKQILLITALVIGAFFSQNSYADLDQQFCDPGEVYDPATGQCGITAPDSSCQIVTVYAPSSNSNNSINYTYANFVAAQVTTSQPDDNIYRNRTRTVSFEPNTASCPDTGTTVTTPITRTITSTCEHYTNVGTASDPIYQWISCASSPDVITLNNGTFTFDKNAPPECPESHPIGPQFFDNGETIGHFCWRILPDEPDPDECDPNDLLNPCPDDPGQCFTGGNGIEYCPIDPDEVCEHAGTVNNIYAYDCPSGCGIINDQWFCAQESDEDLPPGCFAIGGTIICPPEDDSIDDDIEDPEKPIDDMTKSDFKDVLSGIETRIDATNQLLREQIANDNDNTGILKGSIDEISERLGDSLFGDELTFDTDLESSKQQIRDALGITGDESIDDLTVAELSIDSFASEFQWSLGSGDCPSPRPINILNQTFYMDWEPYCNAFNVASYFIMAAAYILSGFIAFGGRK